MHFNFVVVRGVDGSIWMLLSHTDRADAIKIMSILFTLLKTIVYTSAHRVLQTKRQL